jgi:hypothetical protein
MRPLVAMMLATACLAGCTMTPEPRVQQMCKLSNGEQVKFTTLSECLRLDKPIWQAMHPNPNPDCCPSPEGYASPACEKLYANAKSSADLLACPGAAAVKLNNDR